MKVKKLYILCLNNWSWLPASEQTKEINGGTKALYEKYVLRLEESNVCLVNYTQNGMFKPTRQKSLQIKREKIHRRGKEGDALGR